MINIKKVVINIGVGEGGERLERAERMLQQLVGQKPGRTTATKTIRDWGIRKGVPIGCKVTLRKARAEEFLRKALPILDNKLWAPSFTENGVSFGITDHTEFPDMRYDPSVGIFGMDVSVTLARPGARVALRRQSPHRIPKRHRVSEKEGIDFFSSRFGIEAIE